MHHVNASSASRMGHISNLSKETKKKEKENIHQTKKQRVECVIWPKAQYSSESLKETKP